MRPAMYDIIGDNPATATVKAGIMAALVSSTMGRWLNPVAALAYPKDRFAMALGASALGGTASAARAVSTGHTKGGFIPSHVEEEREVQEYFDQLKYIRYRNMMEAAEEAGAGKIADYALKESRKTILYGLHALEAKGNVFQYKTALAAKERAYFEAFVETSESDREEVLSVAPEHMQRALQAVWGVSRAKKNTVEERAEEYWDEHALPEPSWIGWHPEISDQAIRIKAIEGGINGISSSIHSFGFYPAQQNEANARFGYLEPPVNDIHPASMSFELPWKVKQRGGNILSEFSFGAGSIPNITTIRLDDDRSDEMFYFANYIR